MTTININRFAQELLQDVRSLAGSTIRVLNSLQEKTALGIPLDKLVHCLVAAWVVLVASRFVSLKKAVFLAVVIALLKELFDIPAKLVIIREKSIPQITSDSIGDLFFGILGILLACGIITLLGEKWKAQKPELQSIPSLRQIRLSQRKSIVLQNSMLLASGGVFLTFLASGLMTGYGVPMLVIHALAFVAIYCACGRWGGANVLIWVVPLTPFANWIHRRFSRDMLGVNITMILAIMTYELIKGIRTKRKKFIFQASDTLVLAYVACVAFVVILSFFRLGWTERRMFELLAPTTGLVIVFLTNNLVKTTKHVQRAILALVSGFILLCAIGIIEFFSNPIKLEHIPGTVFYDAPGFSIYLSLIWPWVFSLALLARLPMRPLYIIGCFLGITAIALVFVRSAWAGSMIAGLLVLVLTLWKRDWSLGVSAIITIIVSGLILTYALDARTNSGKTTFHSRLTREAISIIRPDAYEHARRSVLDNANRIIQQSPMLGSTGLSAHTLFQAQAISYGIPVAILGLLAVVGLLVNNWVLTIRCRDSTVFALTVGVTGTLVSGLAVGVGWSPLSKPIFQTFLWYLLALVAPAAIAFSKLYPEPEAPQVKRKSHTKPEARPFYKRPFCNERFLFLAIALVCFAVVGLLLFLIFRS